MRLFIVLLLLLISNYSFAESIDIGDKKVEFPNVNGYSTIDNNTKQFNIIESSTPDNRRLLFVYVPSEVASEINKGKVLKFDNYILCKSHRQSESKNITKKQFRPRASKMVKSFNQTWETIDYDEIARLIRNTIKQQQNVDIEIDFGKPKLLKKAKFENDIVSLIILSNLEIAAGDTDVSAIMIVKYYTTIIKGKTIYIGVYRILDSKNDLMAVDNLGDKFMSELLKINDEI